MTKLFPHEETIQNSPKVMFASPFFGDLAVARLQLWLWVVWMCPQTVYTWYGNEWCLPTYFGNDE